MVQTESYDPAPEPAPVPTVSYQTFTMTFLHTVTGSTIRDTDMFGCRMPDLISGPIVQMGTGSIPMPAGPGHQIIVGAGRHSITGAGFMKAVMDGCGFPETNGRPPG